MSTGHGPSVLCSSYVVRVEVRGYVLDCGFRIVKRSVHLVFIYRFSTQLNPTHFYVPRWLTNISEIIHNRDAVSLAQTCRLRNSGHTEDKD